MSVPTSASPIDQTPPQDFRHRRGPGSDGVGRVLSLGESFSLYTWFVAAVIGIPIASVLILINPYDQIGAIDAFFYRAYALHFADLINRYGPYYFAYRIAHIGWAYLFERLLGDYVGYLVWKIAQMSVISACVWWILKLLTSPKMSCWLIALLLTSPWILRGVDTYFTNGSSLLYTFATIGCLSTLSRRNFEGVALSLSAGAFYALLENTNTSLIIAGGLLFVGYYATAIKMGSMQKLFVSVVFAMVGFFATQVVILFVWSADLVFRSGTPPSSIRDWIIDSIQMKAWNTDMFGFVVARAVMQDLSANLTPSAVALLRSGNVHIIAPPLIVASALLFRLWAPHSRRLGSVTSYSLAQRVFDPILVSAVLVVGACYVSSESTGNLSLKLPYYFVYILPITFLVSFAHIGLSLQIVKADAGKEVHDAAEYFVMLVVAMVPVVFILLNLAPSEMEALFTAKLATGALVVLIIVSAVVASLPIVAPQIASVAAAFVVMSGSMLFLSSAGYGHGEYRLPFSSENGVLGADLAAAQVRLLNFTAKYAPPAGVMPQSNPILNWHPNSYFTDSLSANFLADNYTLQAGHSSGGLPQLDDHAMAQLRQGIRRDIVLTYMTEEQGKAAHQALDTAGVGYDVLGQMKFQGKAESVFFEYIRVTHPPPN